VSSSVAIIQRRVPHYREAFFAGLHEHLGLLGITLHVIVSSATSGAPVIPGRPPWFQPVKSRRLTIGNREAIWQCALRATARHDLVIIELAPRIVSNYALIARSRRGGPPVGGFGHGRNFVSTRSPGPRSAHAMFVRSVDWCFAYNDLSRDVFIGLGVPPGRVTAINNTIDTRRLSAAIAEHRRCGTNELRRSLGILGAPVALYCGSLYRGKRLGFLFEAALRLRKKHSGFTLVVLGDGPCEEEVKAFAGAHDWVHYFGRVVGVERAKYLALADVTLIPGLVGLVVLDAFAAGAPLVTTESSSHGPEIGYLRHAENGWSSPDTLDAYVNAVSLLLSDDQLLRRLQQGCAEAVQRYPLEQMVSRFSDGIVAALGRHQTLATDSHDVR